MRDQSSFHSPSLAPPPLAEKQPITALALVLRQARKLHRAAQSSSLLLAMPALRRVHAAGIIPNSALSRLFRDRNDLKRKHFLRTLAVEAGFAHWEDFRPHLDQMPPEAFEHFNGADERSAVLNLWFSNEAQAQAYASVRGGRVLRFGTQALVIPPDAQAGASAGATR